MVYNSAPSAKKIKHGILGCTSRPQAMPTICRRFAIIARADLNCAFHEQVTLFVVFSKLAAMRTRIAAALPAPDSNKPLRPPGAFQVRS